MIALVVLDASNPFFADIAGGVEPIATQLGSMVVVCDTGGDAKREQRYLSQLEEQRVQGVLITPVAEDGRGLARLRQRGTPVVLVDGRGSSPKSCCVSVDDVLGGKLAIEHLRSIGCDRIALVGGHDGIRQVGDRRRGARASEAESLDQGRPIALTTLDSPEMSFAAGRELGTQLAEMTPSDRPNGVFCANDLIALGVMHQLVAAGVQIPHDIAVVGYDDIEFAQAAIVPLTSLRQPRSDLGKTAAQLLVSELEDGDQHRHRHVIFDPELIVRESTNRPPRRSRSRPT